jgi:hypothetical protein
LAKKKSAQNKLPPLFISLKVALGAQEAPQKKLELSLIGKAKIDQLVTNDTHCGRVLWVISPKTGSYHPKTCFM